MGITDPAEEYFKDGVWGWDATDGVWVKVPVDHASGALKTQVVASPEPYPIATIEGQQETIALLRELVALLRQAIYAVG